MVHVMRGTIFFWAELGLWRNVLIPNLLKGERETRRYPVTVPLTPRQIFNPIYTRSKEMINIKNKEKEQCLLMVVDMQGRVCAQTYVEPESNIILDIKDLLSGIYTLIFKTETTSHSQQILKY